MNGHRLCQESEFAAWSYHDVEDVLVLGLVVQPLGSVEHASAGVNPEFPHAGRVHAAVDAVAQLVFLVSVCGFDLQDLCIWEHVLGDRDVVIRLREFWAVIIIIQHFDKYLQLNEDKSDDGECQFAHR